MKDNLYIGIDCGATKIMVQSARFDKTSQKIIPGNINEEFLYSEHPKWNSEFIPVSLYVQKIEYQKKKIELTKDEIKQGNVICDIISDILSKFSEDKIGLCFPGIKNKNGIVIMANGPRIPNFINKIDNINDLLNDSDCCVIGEWKSTIGKMQDVINGIYIGGGTGIADGIICDNRLINFKNSKILKSAWQLMTSNNESVESFLSPSGILKRYNQKYSSNIETLSELINVHKLNSILEDASNAFSMLIKNRIQYFQLKNEDIEKIVIGQRLGQFFKNSDSSIINIFQRRTDFPIELSYDRRTAALGAAWKKACL